MFQLNNVELSFLGVLSVLLVIEISLAIGRVSNFNLIATELGRYNNKTQLQIQLNKKMTLLGVIAQNVFYIGLIGTIWGVSSALSQLGSGNKAEIIAAVGVALISTATSVFVALVGSTVHSFLSSKIDEILLKWDIHHGFDIKK